METGVKRRPCIRRGGGGGGGGGGHTRANFYFCRSDLVPKIINTGHFSGFRVPVAHEAMKLHDKAKSLCRH